MVDTEAPAPRRAQGPAGLHILSSGIIYLPAPAGVLFSPQRAASSVAQWNKQLEKTRERFPASLQEGRLLGRDCGFNMSLHRPNSLKLDNSKKTAQQTLSPPHSTGSFRGFLLCASKELAEDG